MTTPSPCFLAAGCLLLGSCSTAKLTTLASPDTPTVFLSKAPTRAYTEVAYVETTGSIFSTRQRLLRQLQQRRASQGDALVQVRFDYHFWWPHASAVVIKYQ